MEFYFILTFIYNIYCILSCFTSWYFCMFCFILLLLSCYTSVLFYFFYYFIFFPLCFVCFISFHFVFVICFCYLFFVPFYVWFWFLICSLKDYLGIDFAGKNRKYMIDFPIGTVLRSMRAQKSCQNDSFTAFRDIFCEKPCLRLRFRPQFYIQLVKS